MNVILLKRGYARLTDSEYKNFTKGNTIMGIDSSPEELNRWQVEQEEEAKGELKKYRCSYEKYNDYLWECEEFALEYCTCDDDGEFIAGSDYEFAEEDIKE